VLGPFLNVIFRPGSAWIEVQHPGEQGWETRSVAPHARILVRSEQVEDSAITDT
jgi:hypothetical protein